MDIDLDDKSVKVIYNSTAYSRSDYAAMNLHDRDIMRIARKEGAEENARENAINFYKNGVSIEVIAKSMNKTIEEVQAIINSEK